MQFDVRFTHPEKIGIAGALTVVLSAFLPWVTLGLGRVSESGLAVGYPGQITLTLGVVAFAGIVHWGWRVRTRALLAVVGLFAVALVWATVLGLAGDVNPGLGLVTTALGAAMILVDGLYGLAGDFAVRRRVTA
jgi:peptidoglycan/LPS O-acetylase OafA/YrhL